MGLSAVEESASELELDRYGNLREGFDARRFLRDILTAGLEAAAGPALFRELGTVFVAVILCAAVKTVFPSLGEGFDAVTLAGTAAVTLLLAGGQETLLLKTEGTLWKLQDTANVFLPVLSSAALLSGQVTGAAAKYASAALFLNVLINLCCGFVLPVIRMYVAGAAAEAAVGGGVMRGDMGFLKWCVTTALTGLMLAFSLFLSLTSLTVNSADAAVVRSAKTAISTLLPIVGSIAGDAASSLLAAAGVIRQTVGGFGLLAVTALLLAPFLQAGLRCLLLKGLAAVAAELLEGGMGTLLKRLGEAMSMLAASVGACGLMLFFSVYSLIGTVTP